MKKLLLLVGLFIHVHAVHGQAIEEKIFVLIDRAPDNTVAADTYTNLTTILADQQYQKEGLRSLVEYQTELVHTDPEGLNYFVWTTVPCNLENVQAAIDKAVKQLSGAQDD